MKTFQKALFIAITFLFLNLGANAQINAGLGLDHGSAVDEFGLDLRIGYQFNEQFNVVGDFSMFFVDDDGRYVKNRYWNEFNINIHYYYLVSDESFSPYSLIGLNTTFWGTRFEDQPGLGDLENSDSEIGLNLGGGVDFNLNENFKPFFEVKYLMTDKFNQGEITFGLKYFLN